MNRPRVVFCWVEISGYMASCFRELSAESSVSPFFVAFASGRGDSGGNFADSLLTGLPHHLLEPSERDDQETIRQVVFNHQPDVIVLCGWFHPAYRKLIAEAKKRGIKIIMTMDTPWWGRPRQWIGRLVLRRMLRSVDLMFVTGERSWQYAIRLGIPQAKIRRGMYGIDYRLLSTCLDSRSTLPEWPKRFLFIGRYASEKAVDLLVAGYKTYRSKMAADDDEPWPLVCCGTGPLSSVFENVAGVVDKGFVQPADMIREFSEAGVFVLPSRYDPWPLAIVEACAAGLPVIATEACGSTVELVRSEFNGCLIPTGSHDALVDAMCKSHRNHANLPVWGKRSNQLAAAYSAEMWSKRYTSAIYSVLNENS